MTRPLTVTDLHRLNVIADAVSHGRRVVWMNEFGDRMEGVVRNFTNEDGNFLLPDEDVRDGYVWISSMFEHFVPVQEVLDMIHDGRFFAHV